MFMWLIGAPLILSLFLPLHSNAVVVKVGLSGSQSIIKIQDAIFRTAVKDFAEEGLLDESLQLE